MAVLIETQGLTHRYGSVLALDSVHIQVEDGITGLLGPNGAGKSTAIKLFLGLLRPSAGSVEVMGHGAAHAVAARTWLGYMPEYDCLPTDVSATEFLTHIAQVSGIPPKEARIRAADVLRHVALDEERYRAMGGYSTGMKQRVKLAQALVHDPRLVLLDEPTAGLDPAGRDEMLELIQRTGRDFGISMLVSSHLMGEVEQMCDAIIVLEQGQVTHAGRVSEFTAETQEVVVDLTGEAERVVASLREQGLQVRVEGASIVASIEDPAHYDAIRDAIADAGVGLRRMVAQRSRLTDIFRDAPA